MKQTIFTKLNNSRRTLNTNNALDVIKNSTVGEKATGTTKKVAAAPKKDEKGDQNSRRDISLHPNIHNQKPIGKLKE